jgi:ferredoxin
MCVGCGMCVRACSVSAITGEKKQPHKIDNSLCIQCGSCFDACKFSAVLKE